MEQHDSSKVSYAGESSIPKSDSQFFDYGKVRIKISEHFAKNGKTIDCVLEDVIQHAAIAS